MNLTEDGKDVNYQKVRLFTLDVKAALLFNLMRFHCVNAQEAKSKAGQIKTLRLTQVDFTVKATSMWESLSSLTLLSNRLKAALEQPFAY